MAEGEAQVEGIGLGLPGGGALGAGRAVSSFPRGSAPHSVGIGDAVPSGPDCAFTPPCLFPCEVSAQMHGLLDPTGLLQPCNPGRPPEPPAWPSAPGPLPWADQAEYRGGRQESRGDGLQGRQRATFAPRGAARSFASAQNNEASVFFRGSGLLSTFPLTFHATLTTTRLPSSSCRNRAPGK